MIHFNRMMEHAPFDKADAAMLVMSIYACVDQDEDRLVGGALDQVYAVATSAALALHNFAPDEGDEWDGVHWFELLEDSGPDSLAYALAVSIRLYPQGETPEAIVCKWLTSAD